MTELSVIQPGGALTLFDPSQAKVNDAKAQAIIEYAAKVRDWPLLQQAIEKKIEEQTEFVRWWDEGVGVRHGLNHHSIDNADPGSLSKSDAEDLTGISQQQVSRWRKRLKDAKKYETELFDTAYKKAMAATAETGAAHVANNTGNNEWYTPPEYIEAARAAMEGIDLDPASSDVANRTVKAARHFTLQDDGLMQPWAGRVWLNPPYSGDLVSKFCEKLLDAYTSGDVWQACLLVNNATETQWFQSLLKKATSVCFPSGRIRFFNKAGELENSPLQGQTVLYFGGEKEKFSAAFSGFGPILVAML
jgi:hypothetical protein